MSFLMGPREPSNSPVLGNSLRVLVSPANANVDIVAVHGLNPFGNPNHAEDTWKASNGAFWLRDDQYLPKHAANARIMLYGYNSNVAFRTSTAGVDGQVDDLLDRLDWKRTDCPNRPLVFLCHSLGGIIVKQTLVRAHQSDQVYRSISNSTFGLVFFATLHKGGNHAELGDVAASIARFILQQPNNTLMESLKKHSLFADDIVRGFRNRLDDYQIVSFYETLNSFPIMASAGIIVDQKSATIGLPDTRERQISRAANHSDICKFSDPDGEDFEQVARHITRLVHGAVGVSLIKSLKYPGIDQRQHEIEDPWKGTFPWLNIQEPSQRLFWVSGKAGSGKSTLMRALFRDPNLLGHLKGWAAAEPVVLAGHFFFDRGTSQLQKSREGLLRSLLYQIFNKCPDLASTMVATAPEMSEQFKEGSHNWEWLEMRHLLLRSVEQKTNPRKFFFFIDGLDEYGSLPLLTNEHSYSPNAPSARPQLKALAHLEIANLVIELASFEQVKICVASRPLIKFEDLLGKCSYLRLEELTANDISTYVVDKLNSSTAFERIRKIEPDRSIRFIQNVVSKASGVFLWVKLVTEKLVDCILEGCHLEELQEKLEDLPDELGGGDGLFTLMVKDIRPEWRAESAQLLRMKSCTHYISTALLYWLAIIPQSDEMRRRSIQLTKTEATMYSQQTTTRIVSRSGGLLQVSEHKKFKNEDRELRAHGIDPNLVVDFMHQCAKDFIENADFGELFGVDATRDEQGFDANMSLLHALTMYMRLGIDLLPKPEKKRMDFELSQGERSFVQWNKIYQNNAKAFAREKKEELLRKYKLDLSHDFLRLVTYDALRAALQAQRSLPEQSSQIGEAVEDLDRVAIRPSNAFDIEHYDFLLINIPKSPRRHNRALDDRSYRILAVAIKLGLEGFVKAKLENGVTFSPGFAGRPLLDFCVTSGAEIGDYEVELRQDLRTTLACDNFARARITEALLCNGEDPNARYRFPGKLIERDGRTTYETSTVWEQLLAQDPDWGCASFPRERDVHIGDARQALAIISKHFVSHGANPCKRVMNEPYRSTCVKFESKFVALSPICCVSWIFQEQPEERNEIIAMLVERGGALFPGERGWLQHWQQLPEEKLKELGECVTPYKEEHTADFESISGFFQWLENEAQTKSDGLASKMLLAHETRQLGYLSKQQDHSESSMAHSENLIPTYDQWQATEAIRALEGWSSSSSSSSSNSNL